MIGARSGVSREPQPPKHRALRRILASLLGLLAIVATAAIFSLRPADPTPGAERSPDPGGEAAAARARAADDALAELQRELEAARQAARRGSAALGDGEDEDPAVELESAAGHLDASVELLERAIDDLAQLEASPGCAATPPPAPSIDLRAADLREAADGFRAAADAAEPVLTLRRASEATLLHLRSALAALELRALSTASGAHREAERQLAAARAAYADLAADAPTLVTWLDTADQMLGAVGEMAAAMAARDQERIDAAGDDYRRAAESAGVADRALAIGLAESAAAVTDGPLAMVGGVSREVDRARAAVAPLLHPDGCG